MKKGHLILLLSLLICFTAGCAGHRHRLSHGTQLSEAMDKASIENVEDRSISTSGDIGSHSHLYPLWFLFEYHTSSSAYSHSESDQTRKKKYGSAVGLSAGSGLITGDKFYRLNHADLSYGIFSNSNERGDVFLGFGNILIDEAAELNASIDDAWLWTIGLRIKHYTTPEHTFLGHYFIFGLSYNYLYWTYENDIQVDNRIVGSDGIDGWELFGGMGFNIAQTRNFDLGLEVLPSAILWNSHTDEGFEDNVFGAFFMLKIRVTMSYISRPE